MGRHSAPDDDDELIGVGGDSGLAVLDPDDETVDDEPRGRHAVASAPTVAMLEPAVFAGEAPVQAPPPVGTPTAETAAVVAPDRAVSGTRADLAMLRSNSGLRARAAAAVVVPIALYVLVLAILGRFDVFVFWVWIPIVVAGVLFGLMLDLADRKRKAAGPPDEPLSE